MVQRSGWVDLVLGATAAALDHDGFDVVEEPVQQGRGEGGVVVEDLLLVFCKRPVRLCGCLGARNSPPFPDGRAGC